MVSLLRTILLFLIAGQLLACSGDDAASPVLPEPGEDAKTLCLLFSSNGLGDASYNDPILAAAANYAFTHDGIVLDYLSPKSLEEGEAYFLRWLETAPGKDRSMMVLTDNAYESLPEKYKERIDPEKHCILQLDSRRDDLPAHTAYIRYYGVCYWAARMQSTFTGTHAESAIMKANNRNPVLGEMEAGLTHGVEDAGSNVWFTWVLDPDGNGGFDLPQTAYWLVGEVPATVSTVYAIAGGSNMGVYRFTREFPGTLLVPGIDTDQSGLSSDVPFSLLKHTDRLLTEYIARWDNGEPQPASPCVVGLAEGYTDLVISKDYRQWYADYMKFKETAIEKESAYDTLE